MPGRPAGLATSSDTCPEKATLRTRPLRLDERFLNAAVVDGEGVPFAPRITSRFNPNVT
jgi:hypothetical protein